MTTKSRIKQRGGLDVFRLIAAFLVVAIHTSPLSSFSAEADFFLTRILARIAVPFFLMVTGHFVLGELLLGECRLNRGRQITGVLRHVRKLAVLYGIAMLLYLPLGIYAGHYGDMSVSAALKMIVFDGSFYHLWYFPACILGILLVCLLRRFLPFQAVAVIGVCLYGIGLFGDSYYGLLSFLPGVEGVYDGGFSLFSYTRNGLFFAPVFLLLGAAAGKRKSVFKPFFAAAGFAVSFLLMTAEGFLLRSFGLQRHDSMYVLLIPVLYFLYRWILTWQIKVSKEKRALSGWVYILHPAMIVMVRGLAKAFGLTELLVENSLVHYLAVSAAALGAAAAVTAGLPAVKRPAERLFKAMARSVGKRVDEGEASEKYPFGRAWIELDRGALEQNVRALLQELPTGCELMPAVKAQAYGHGAVGMAFELNRLGINAFCVASAGEGTKLRKNGIKGEILVLGYTHPGDFPLLLRYGMTQAVVDYEYALLLEQAGEELRAKADFSEKAHFHVHIAVDTGMHRLGIPSDEIEKLSDIFHRKNLIIDGIFTHLCADDTDSPSDRAYTDMQANRFYEVLDRLKEAGIPCPKAHLASSYGVLNYPSLAGDYARVGIALYGVLSTGEDTLASRIPLLPVLSLKARVAAVKNLHKGEAAGYGLSFVAGEEMRIAVLSIGYGDGFPRALSCGRGEVLINGYRAAVLGRICMDQTIVDVSSIPDVRQGDIAVIVGSSGEEVITVCDIAGQADSITNEILSRLGERLERVWI